MDRKLLFYNTYGVEEYYLYEPDRNRLDGWNRSADGLLDRIKSMFGWVSPRLGIRFELGEELQLYRPDGTPFFSFAEINQLLAQERQRAAQERQRAEQSEQRLTELEALLQRYRDRFGELDS
jgi:hypothetical protein